ncbi:MAG: rRNA pseudouridine synthase [Deltaproteobacteria bacterium]|nr:rRNA pseudouridine synthase [Deltaproteobacteria bacterium]
MQERLQKLIALAGVCSRRDAEHYISEGRVRVNGKVVSELGSKADPKSDTIQVDDVALDFSEHAPVILMMHKPPKVIVTADDPQKRVTILDLLSKPAYQRFGPRKLPRVFPVGRLDYDAEGLILLTNDGELADQLTHPRHHVPKTYLVKVSGVVEDKGLRRMQQGIHLKEADGRVVKTLPATIELHRKTETNAWYSATVVEGRNRLLKRLFQAVGHPVRRILRIEFGGIKLGDLPQGEWRALTPDEERRVRKWGETVVPRPVPAPRPALSPAPGGGSAKKKRPKRHVDPRGPKRAQRPNAS